MGLPIFFARGFVKTGGRIALCARQNVVLHASMKACPFRTHLRGHVGRNAKPRRKSAQYSSAKPDSQFKHRRYHIANCGKILAFTSAENIIRAGKHTHADALVALLLYMRWGGAGGWPARINTPNMVVSGKLDRPPNPSIKHHAKATHSKKFPGVAIRLKCGVTTEVYESGAFILPGIVAPGQLATALAELVEIA